MGKPPHINASSANGSTCLPSPVRPSSLPLSAGPRDHPSSSSFVDIPAVAFTGVGLLPPIDRIVREHVCAGAPDMGATLQAIVAPAAGVGALSSSSSSSSTASILRFALAVAIVNHARRTFLYGAAVVGFFALRPDPADDWRLVLARPDVFLEDSLAAMARWQTLAGMAGGKLLWDAAAGRVALVIVSNKYRRHHPLGQVAAALLYMVWLLSAVEYAVAQSSTAVALVWSAVRLAAQHQRHPAGLLLRIVSRHRMAAALLAWQTADYAARGLVPLLGTAAVRNGVCRRKPGVLLVVCLLATWLWVLLRYRSRLYIAIETSGLFVFIACGAAAAGMLLAVRQTARREGKAKSE